jgi:hypothetical protein
MTMDRPGCSDTCRRRDLRSTGPRGPAAGSARGRRPVPRSSKSAWRPGAGQRDSSHHQMSGVRAEPREGEWVQRWSPLESRVKRRRARWLPPGRLPASARFCAYGVCEIDVVRAQWTEQCAGYRVDVWQSATPIISSTRCRATRGASRTRSAGVRPSAQPASRLLHVHARVVRARRHQCRQRAASPAGERQGCGPDGQRAVPGRRGSTPSSRRALPAEESWRYFPPGSSGADSRP